MPLMDMSEALDEPLWNDTAQIIRRRGVVDGNGVLHVTETYEDITVIPVAGDADTLVRDRDQQHIDNTQRFITKAQINLLLTGYDTDRIAWNGRTYVVRAITDWSTWGAGFVSVACQMLNPDGGQRTDSAV